MAEHIHKCPVCNKYTLQATCPQGHGATLLPRPPKFSLEEKYAQYKREVKKEEYRKRGLY